MVFGMLVESAIANLDRVTAPPDPADIDWLDLTWLECRHRFARRRTRGGQEVRILLRLATTLRHGDVLGYWADGRTVIVNLLPTEVCVVIAKSPGDLAAVAFQLGNLHVPIELTADRMVMPSGAIVEAALAKLGFAFELRRQLFQPNHWPDSVQLGAQFTVNVRSAKTDGITPRTLPEERPG